MTSAQFTGAGQKTIEEFDEVSLSDINTALSSLKSKRTINQQASMKDPKSKNKMLKTKQIVTLDQVIIKRYGDFAWLIYKNNRFEKEKLSLNLGQHLLDKLSDQEVLDRFNAHINWLNEVLAIERPLEIEDGYAQLEWSEEFERWSMVGEVLRATVCWQGGPDDGRVAFQIDDKELSADELVDLFEEFEGSGMRIEFVDKDNLTRRPKPLIRKKKTKAKQIPYPKLD